MRRGRGGVEWGEGRAGLAGRGASAWGASLLLSFCVQQEATGERATGPVGEEASKEVREEGRRANSPLFLGESPGPLTQFHYWPLGGALYPHPLAETQALPHVTEFRSWAGVRAVLDSPAGQSLSHVHPSPAGAAPTWALRERGPCVTPLPNPAQPGLEPKSMGFRVDQRPKTPCCVIQPRVSTPSLPAT